MSQILTLAMDQATYLIVDAPEALTIGTHLAISALICKLAIHCGYEVAEEERRLPCQQ